MRVRCSGSASCLCLALHSIHRVMYDPWGRTAAVVPPALGVLPFFIGSEINETSTGAYRSCAALFDISNPLRYLVKSSLVWLVLVWFGLVDFCLVCMVLV